MSQLVRAIEAIDTKERKVLDSFSPLFRDVFSAKEDIAELRTHETHDVLKMYRVGVTIGSQVYVSEHETLHGVSPLEEAIKRTRRQVVEAIFGEFRADIVRLERAIYDRDFAKSCIVLAELEKKMFGIE